MNPYLWRTIESAPKDGTPILVAGGNHISVAAWDDQSHGTGRGFKVQGPGWRVYANGQLILDEGWDEGGSWTMEIEPIPTHWMPLPGLPDSTTGNT
jgi:hypothetical protein